MKCLPQRRNHCRSMSRFRIKRQYTLPNTQTDGRKYGWRISPNITFDQMLTLSQRSYQGACGGDAWYHDPHLGWDWRELSICAQRRREFVSLSQGQLSRFQHCLGLRSVVGLHALSSHADPWRTSQAQLSEFGFPVVYPVVILIQLYSYHQLNRVQRF